MTLDVCELALVTQAAERIARECDHGDRIIREAVGSAGA